MDGPGDKFEREERYVMELRGKNLRESIILEDLDVNERIL
jgi:hypothetical protein